MLIAPSLFMKAYPCVIDLTAEKCTFAAPSVASWRAVAIAVTDPTFPVPNSSGIFSIALGVFSAIVVLFRHNYLVGERAKYCKWVPNFMALGLAFVLPATQYGTAMVIGSIIAVVWAKRYPAGYDIYFFAVAAGMIAGEGMGGVGNALLEIAGVGSSVYASPAGCPGGVVC